MPLRNRFSVRMERGEWGAYITRYPSTQLLFSLPDVNMFGVGNSRRWYKPWGAIKPSSDNAPFYAFLNLHSHNTPGFQHWWSTRPRESLIGRFCPMGVRWRGSGWEPPLSLVRCVFEKDFRARGSHPHPRTRDPLSSKSPWGN